MIVKKDDREDIDIDELGFDDTSGDMTINLDKMASIYEMFSTNLYKDAISSIVRELVSNAFDAQIANGSTKPVIVGGEYQDKDFYFYVKDNGEGISPEKWKTVLSKFMESTKQSSNEYHGFWGLGSKSPFSYTNLYYFETVYEGIEYLYIMFKSDTGMPKEDLISSMPTDKPNGTTVKFSIGDKGYRNNIDYDYRNPGDYNKFEDAINNQLAYFDNVYVKHFDFNNEYKIFEGKTYKYRTDTKEDEMHIVLGKVKYPIDWKTLGRDRINIPVAVKFNIGDLMVIPSREDLKYTVETKNSLNKGIDDCIEEMKYLLSQGYNTLEEVKKEEKGDRTIRAAEGIYIPFKTGNYGYDSITSNIIRYPFNVPKATLREFLNTPIKIPDNPYFIFKVKSIISNGRIQEKDNHENINLWAYTHPERVGASHLPLYRTSKFVSDKYKNFDIQNAYLVTKRPIGLKHIMSVIGLMISSPTPFRENRRIVGVPMIGDFGNGIHNKIQLAKYYKKVITEKFVEKTQSYDKHDVHYSKMLEYEAKYKKPKRNFNKEAGEIFASFGDDLNRGKIKTKLSSIKSKERSIIVYGDNSQKKALAAIELLLSDYFYFKYGHRIPSVYIVVMVNKVDIKIMEEFNEGRKPRDIIAYNTEEFILNNKVFIKEATKVIAEPLLSNIRINSTVLKASPKLEKLYNYCEAYKTRYELDKLMKTDLGVELLKIIKEKKLYDQEVLDNVNILKKISEDLAIFNKMEVKEYNIDDVRAVATILKLKGYPIDEFYVFEPTDEEWKWMEEWIHLANYYKKVQSDVSYSRTRIEGESYKFNLIKNILNKEEWQSYRKSKKQNKLGKTLLLL